MSDIELVAAMEVAAQAVGAFVAQSPVPTPAALTWAEFAERFDALDKPGAALLREKLAPLRPRAAWAEELDADLPASGESWVVDPFDGAVQYLQELPYWSVSVTLVRNRVPVAAVLHSALRSETCTAVAGGGAWRNGITIVPSQKMDLSLSMLGTSHPPRIAVEPALLCATPVCRCRPLPPRRSRTQSRTHFVADSRCRRRPTGRLLGVRR